MRKKRNPLCSMELHVPHEICTQLSGISQWLDAHPQFNDWIYENLSSGNKTEYWQKWTISKIRSARSAPEKVFELRDARVEGVVLFL